MSEHSASVQPFTIPLTTFVALSESSWDAGKIVEEEERPGSSDYNIVHAHGNQVDPHGIMTVHQEGNLQFVPTPSVEETRIGFL